MKVMCEFSVELKSRLFDLEIIELFPLQMEKPNYKPCLILVHKGSRKGIGKVNPLRKLDNLHMKNAGQKLGLQRCLNMGMILYLQNFVRKKIEHYAEDVKRKRDM